MLFSSAAAFLFTFWPECLIIIPYFSDKEKVMQRSNKHQYTCKSRSFFCFCFSSVGAVDGFTISCAFLYSALPFIKLRFQMMRWIHATGLQGCQCSKCVICKFFCAGNVVPFFLQEISLFTNQYWTSVYSRHHQITPLLPGYHMVRLFYDWNGSSRRNSGTLLDQVVWIYVVHACGAGWSKF